MNTARRTRSSLALTPVLVLACVVALAACGSDSKSSTKASTDSTSSSTTGTATAVAIKSADNSTLGRILVTADGKTVYTLSKDGTAVACTGGCLTAWPPVMLAAGEKAGGSDVKDLSTNDTKQVTSGGLPLYTFSGDSAAGDAHGEGISSFGGVWHVVMVGGAATSESTTTTTSGSGY
jgi:predicted lipoprotein with Yx(FWY)xxD motif